MSDCTSFVVKWNAFTAKLSNSKNACTEKLDDILSRDLVHSMITSLYEVRLFWYIKKLKAYRAQEKLL